jgi:hypothetical protein
MLALSRVVVVNCHHQSKHVSRSQYFAHKRNSIRAVKKLVKQDIELVSRREESDAHPQAFDDDDDDDDFEVWGRISSNARHIQNLLIQLRVE